jgi:hypothetical protein
MIIYNKKLNLHIIVKIEKINNLNILFFILELQIKKAK